MSVDEPNPEETPSAFPIGILLGLFFLILVGLSVTTYVVAFDQDVQTIESRDER